MSVISRRRAKRALVSLCASCLLLAFAASAGVQDARVLWVTLPGSVLRVSPLDGTVARQLAGLKQPGSLGVEGTNDTVWIYGQKDILGYDAQGNLLVSLPLPNDFHGGTPAGMVVDNAAGNIWIAIKKDLYRLDMSGNLKADIALPYNASGLGLDVIGSRLWVAEQGGIQTFDAAGNVGLNLTLGANNSPTAIAYDTTLKQAWVLFPGSVERLDAAGNVAASATLTSDLSQFIAADGQGGAWVAGQQNLARLDTTGQAQFVSQPFAGLSGGNTLALGADSLDHSVWVANALHLRHYGSNGGFITEATLSVGPGNGNGLDQVGLYVDTVPPTVSISAPADGTYTNHNQPTLTLTYSDIGSGVDSTSVAVTNGAAAVPVSCQANADGSGATCTPTSALPDGIYTLSVTVRDYAGNTSQAATVSFTVDTIPPTITITSPLSTGAPNYTLTGNLSEAGTLSVNGTLLPLGAANSFSEALALHDGANNVSMIATDLAGNVTTQTIVIYYSAAPLGPPSGSLVSFQPGAPGYETLVGQAGAASSGEIVTVTDINTGAMATGTVNSDGSFSVNIQGAGTDNYSVVLSTLFGNQSQTVYIHANDAPLAIQVMSPANGASINAGSIDVTGTYSGPSDVGITVNGQPATLFDGRFVANGVPLTTGSNTLTVVATGEGGLTSSRTLTVTSLGAATLTLTASPTDTGNDWLRVYFYYSYSGSAPLMMLQMSYNGNGSYYTISGGSIPSNNQDSNMAELGDVYSTPGIYPATLIATDVNGVQYQAQVYIVMQDTAQMDAMFRTVWGDYTGALASGSKAAAMDTLDYTAQQKFGPVFDVLMPSMAGIVGSFSPLLTSSISTDTAEYAIHRTSNGQDALFFVYFIKDNNGVWRLDEM